MVTIVDLINPFLITHMELFRSNGYHQGLGAVLHGTLAQFLIRNYFLLLKHYIRRNLEPFSANQ